MGGPWFVAGAIIGLDKWRPSFSPDKLDGFSAPIWVRLPQLPLQYWDATHIARFVAILGQPLWLDASTQSWDRTSYARICVRIDLSKKLLGGVWIDGIDGKFFQRFEFEGISHLCFNCCKIGHKHHQCKEPRLAQPNPALEEAVPDSQLASPSPPRRMEAAEARPSNPPAPSSAKAKTAVPPRSYSDLFADDTIPAAAKGEYTGDWTLVQRRRPSKPNGNPSASSKPKQVSVSQGGQPKLHNAVFSAPGSRPNRSPSGNPSSSLARPLVTDIPATTPLIFGSNGPSRGPLKGAVLNAKPRVGKLDSYANLQKKRKNNFGTSTIGGVASSSGAP